VASGDVGAGSTGAFHLDGICGEHGGVYLESGCIVNSK
jgi:hypothetical protein